MKKKSIYVAVVAALVLYLISPYWAAYNLFNAIKEGDSHGLKKNINFPELRSSLKDEMKERFATEMKQLEVKNKNDNDAFSEIGKGIAAVMMPSLIETVIDNMITPTGLKALISNPVSVIKNGANGEEIENNSSFEIPDIKYAFFKGITDFSIRTSDDLTIRMNYEGFTWKVTSISLPTEADIKAKVAQTPKSKLILGYWSGKKDGKYDYLMAFLPNEKMIFGNAENPSYHFVSDSDLKIQPSEKAMDAHIISIDDEKMELLASDFVIKFQRVSKQEFTKLKVAEAIRGISNALEVVWLTLNLFNTQTEFIFPYNASILTKDDYYKYLKQISQGLDARDGKSIWKYEFEKLSRYKDNFDIVNVSSQDLANTIFLISSAKEDSNLPAGSKIIVTLDGQVKTIENFSLDGNPNLPSRIPVILQ